jgi:tetratricopeptide (TPR) repeat protein
MMSIQSPQADRPPTTCPECGRAVPAGAGECPFCYQPLCMSCGAAVGRYWPRCRQCGTERDLLCPTCHTPIRPRDRHCRQCGSALLDPGETAAPAAKAVRAQGTQHPAADPWGSSVPVCQACGRKDETLRLVGLPYVVSLLLITFRRGFVGVWCARHRRQRTLLAGAITAVLGWIGIPFGLIYTPLALFKLATGGEQPAEANVRLLQRLADYELEMGNVQGARRCLEQVLRVRDDDAARERLRQHEARYGPPAASPARTFLPVLAGLVGVAITGCVTGLANSTVGAIVHLLSGGAASLLVVILSWTPTIALLFLGGLILSWLVEGTLSRIRCSGKTLGLAFSLLAALIALYGTQQGMVAGLFVQELATGATPPLTLLDLPMILLAVTAGAGTLILASLRSPQASDIIYVILIAAAALYYGWVALRAAGLTVAWQQRLAAVASAPTTVHRAPLRAGWLALGTVVACIGGSFLTLPLSLAGDTLGGLQRVSQAAGQLVEGDLDAGVEALETAVAENPEMGLAHIALGTAFLRTARFEDAVGELEAAVLLNPDMGSFHAFLALAYYMTDRVPQMEEALARAEAARGDDPLANRALCTVYYGLRDMDRAAACCNQALESEPDDASLYASLARVYAAQGRHDEALAAAERGVELDPELADAYVARGQVLMWHKELDAAWVAMSQAREVDPGDASTHASCSYVHFLRGEIDDALAAAEEAVRLDPYNGNARQDLAMAYHAAGDLDRALAAAQEAVRLNPKYDSAYYALGLCYRDLGQEDEAAAAFQSFLDRYWDRAYVCDWKVDAEAWLAAHP